MKTDSLDLNPFVLDYFSTISQDDLKKDVFPKYPEVFNLIAQSRGFGIPWQYKKAAESHKVDQRMFFFESNLGKQYTGNPRYIYERMIERYPNYTYVWCYAGNEKIPGDPIIVDRASAEYYNFLARSRFIINNTTFPLWYHRPETFYFQTWHGTPFKRLHWDISSRPLEKRSTPEFYVKSTKWDALLSPNHYSTEIFQSAFRYEGEIVEYGYPSNDIFYDKRRYSNVREKIRAKLGVQNNNAPIYLYAPTWRDGKHLGNSMFEFNLMLDPFKFIEHAPEDAILLIRSHHMSSSDDKLTSLAGRVIDVSGWDDAIELMCAADVLITDYSSIVFDWYCSLKPVIYYVPDYDQYVCSVRGAYFELSEQRAGEICYTEEELLQTLPKVLKDNSPEYKDFYKTFCGMHDGNSSDRVIDYLLSR
ncbi:CDP-glycerol glycerophosphotransferase family protein [Fictibacillus sp. WQ 8-8]|uniref:CDP-glycerol glycerophosphotransferase family protein n=1 Tax=Fictibacillus sp. WQ 8-8 TaxID=2938788 RepID=UPI00210AE543|nr:CDP-glycerol glycerophosphotransferase family protein [Fictibacillus sp. WQ 8-8]MCQ6264460.1 CDP-glycerol glycerophosphotransferase family protein [Fictibacillus sp. WQ 8-8]